MSEDYIFVRQSFVRGVARAVDIGGVLSRSAYALSDTPEEADARALESDWERVGKDLGDALRRLGDSAEG